MVTFFKEAILPMMVWLMVLASVYIGLVKRPIVPLLLLAFLISLPNVWYPAQQMPLGEKTIDLLTFSSLLGVFFTGMKYQTAPKQGLIITLICFTYISVWNSSMRYGLSMPLTLDNPILADWKNYILMMVMYLTAFNVLRTEQNVRTLLTVMLVVVALLITQNYRSIMAGETYSQTNRASGPFGVVGLNCNHFGAFLADYGVAAFALLSADKTNRWRKALYAFVFFGGIYPIFYTYSRGAYLALLTGLFMIGVLRVRLIIVLLALFAMNWDNILPESVVARINMTSNESGQLEESAALRLVVWDLAKVLFGEYPVTGIGFNGFFFATHGMRLHNTHNYYLQTAAEQGVVGCVLLGTLMLRALWSGFRLFRIGADFSKAVGLAFLSCTLTILVTNIFGDRFSQHAVGAFFFLFMGGVDRLLVLETEKAEATAPSVAGKRSARRKAGPSSRRPPPPSLA